MKSKCQNSRGSEKAENPTHLGHKQDLKAALQRNKETGRKTRPGAWSRPPAGALQGQKGAQGPLGSPHSGRAPGKARGLAGAGAVPTAPGWRLCRAPLRPGHGGGRAAYLARPRPPGRPAGSGKPPGGEARRRWSQRSRDPPASGSLSAHTRRAPL